MVDTIVAIVPIKEHSERIPRKNFRDFNGRPLYHWILDTLENVDEIDKIVVNTDAKQVIDNAPEMFDIEVSVRPERFREDDTTKNLIKYEVNQHDADLFLQTYCTNPLLQSATISEAINRFVSSSDHDSLMGVTAHQKFFYTEDLEPINHNPYNLEPTQDLTPLYEDTTAIYIYTADVIAATGHRIGRNPRPFEINKIEAIDIDVKSDLELAEYFHKRRSQSIPDK